MHELCPQHLHMDTIRLKPDTDDWRQENKNKILEVKREKKYLPSAIHSRIVELKFLHIFPKVVFKICNMTCPALSSSTCPALSASTSPGSLISIQHLARQDMRPAGG